MGEQLTMKKRVKKVEHWRECWACWGFWLERFYRRADSASVDRVQHDPTDHQGEGD